MDELVILDEVGKMEMLCPQFLPAVHKLLDSTVSKKRTILGTIPTPRYGRIIPAVEDIRARDDVLVLHVTKADREELRELLQREIRKIFDNSGKTEAEDIIREILAPFVYTRPIGASSVNSNK